MSAEVSKSGKPVNAVMDKILVKIGSREGIVAYREQLNGELSDRVYVIIDNGDGTVNFRKWRNSTIAEESAKPWAMVGNWPAAAEKALTKAQLAEQAKAKDAQLEEMAAKLAALEAQLKAK